MSTHSVAVLEAGARRASKSPKTIISRLDPAKRLEAYLAAQGGPLEAEGIRSSWPRSATAPLLSTKWETFRYGRRIPSRRSLTRRRRPKSGRSARCCATGGVRCAREHSVMPRHTHIPR